MPHGLDSLPDSAFLHILPGGRVSAGKTLPRSLRILPVVGQNGKVNLTSLEVAMRKVKGDRRIPLEVQRTITLRAQKMLSSSRSKLGRVLPEAPGVVLHGKRNDFVKLATGDGEKLRYQKDILHVGSYTHPKQGWHLPVDQDYLDLLATNFGKFIDRGIQVPITVDHSNKADDAYGNLIEVFRDGDALIGVHEFDDEAAALKYTAKKGLGVSVEIDHDYVATKDAEEIGSALVASSIVQRPVVPGQAEFVRIAASRDGKSPVLHFSETPIGGLLMKDLLAKINGSDLGLELTEEMSGDQVGDAVIAAFADAKTATTEAETKLSTVTTERDGFKAKLADTQPKIKLSRTEESLSKRSLKTELSQLVADGHLNTAAADALLPHLSTPTMLSVAADVEDPGFDGVVAALKLNKASEMGESTEHQTLSRETPGGDDDKKVDEAVTSRMVEAAGGPPKK